MLKLIKRIFTATKKAPIQPKLKSEIKVKETLNTLEYIERVYDSEDIDISPFCSLLRKMNYDVKDSVRVLNQLKEDNIECNNLFVLYPTEDDRKANNPTKLIYCLPNTKILVDVAFSKSTVAYAMEKLLQTEETFDKKLESGFIKEILGHDTYTEFSNKVKALQKAYDENDFSEIVCNLLSEQYRMSYVYENFSDLVDKCSEQELKQLVALANI